ncbi:hypothetical protein JHK82_055024 [Glycine max]|nr:hypothetical protein JHK82_055024 [Glycine max]
MYVSDFLFKLMARIADKIKTIDGSKETLKLAIRIIELWFVGTLGRSEQAEMGDQIHVVCKQDQLKAWKMDLKEGCTYVMHNFRVSKNDGQYRVCDHPYKLTFIGVTVVRQCELDGLPFKKYGFVDFSDVIAGQYYNIIGVVDEVVFRHISPRSKRVVFKLMNLSNQLLSCTLWDDYCVQFLEYLNHHESEGPIIVLLTNARIKEGSYPCSVSNSLKASKLTINELVAPIEEFNQKYRVEVMVNYKNESTKFLLWDRECTELIGQSANEVNTLKIEDGDLDVNASPKALDKLLGHLLAFKTCSKIKATTSFDSNDPVHDESDSVHASVNPASSHTEDHYNQPKTPPHSVHATVNRASHDAEDHFNICDSSENESFGSTEESQTISSVGYPNCESSHHDSSMDTRDIPIKIKFSMVTVMV